jgi:hypothetical protein
MLISSSMHAIAAALMLGAVLLAGCTVYEVGPGVYSTAPAPKFDAAWSATVGAFQDQGVQIVREDRAAGILQGRRGGITITADLRTQADGSVRVELRTTGATDQDPGLINRISNAYDRRMGR